MIETQMKTLFGSNENLLHFLSKSNDLVNLQLIVSFDAQTQELEDLVKSHKLKIMYYQDLMKEFKSDFKLIDTSNHKGDKICTLSYTSGTTGNAKGVMLTDDNFLNAASTLVVAQLGVWDQQAQEVNHDEVYFSYLPLAHVFDRIGVNFTFTIGGSIGFLSAKIDQLTEDLQLLRPTIFVAVPRVLNKIYDRIMSGVAEQRVTRRIVFWQAVVAKSYYNSLYGFVNNKVFDNLVFSKIRSNFGGRLKLIITASAPIAENVL